MIQRRVVLIGAGAVALVVAGGSAAAVRLFGRGTGGEDDYVELLASVRDDYINGRVVEHQGWVLSQHEFDTLGSRGKA